MGRLTEFLNGDMLFAMSFFTMGHILAWYTHNSQFVWEYWANKPILANIVFGVPCGLLFWYGTRYAVSASDMLWTSRFVAFSLSYVTFPLMTWWYLGESMFTTKTLVCTFLAFLIVICQIYIK